MSVEKHYSIASDIIYFIKYYKKYEPAVLIMSGVEILLGAVIPLFGLILPKIAVELVAYGVTVPHAVLVLSLFTIMMIAVNMMSSIASSGKYHLYNMQRANQAGLLFLKSLRVPYSYVESGEMKKLYYKAYQSLEMGDWSASSLMVSGTVSLIINILCFTLYSTVIGTLNVWLLICLVVLAILSYVINMGQIRYEDSLRNEQAEVQRHFSCISDSMGNVKGAKDIRIFGMKSWLIKLRDAVLDEQRKINRKLFLKKSLYEKIGFILSFLRDFGAYAFLLYKALSSEVSAGEFVLYFGAITGFSAFLLSIINAVSQLRQAADSFDYLRFYLELPEEDIKLGERHIDELQTPIEIKFVDVSFSYTDSEEDVEYEDIGDDCNKSKRGRCIFKDFNLTIHAGEKIALVGVNGAGKITLVKLLTGMYNPDKGKILINGIDRNEFPREEIYKLFSVVFQEQLILPFTVGENLAMDREENIDCKRAWEALSKAGLKEFFESKKINLDTFMTKKLFKEGLELSGGQQQRFLLARALYKNAQVLVLDEPTASLDAIAESEVYDNYNKYSDGKTAIFISHRLASTRFSDRIFLLEDGKVIESGTHEELILKNGKYSEMYKIQSNYYKEPNIINF